jgi:hypothetical protein
MNERRNKLTPVDLFTDSGTIYIILLILNVCLSWFDITSITTSLMKSYLLNLSVGSGKKGKREEGRIARISLSKMDLLDENKENST